MKVKDHAMDALRYMVMELDNGGISGAAAVGEIEDRREPKIWEAY